jgi:hypothetical protein
VRSIALDARALTPKDSAVAGEFEAKHGIAVLSDAR